jgi:hypothetical protein
MAARAAQSASMRPPVPTAPETDAVYTVTFHVRTAASPLTAADAALRIGLGAAVDDLGQGWPEGAQRMSIGDLLTVRSPAGVTTRLRVNAVGFTLVTPPAQPTCDR